MSLDFAEEQGLKRLKLSQNAVLSSVATNQR